MNWQTWKFNGNQYLAVFNGEGWHVIRADGENFGTWMTVEGFRKLQAAGDPNGQLGLPGSMARLAVRVTTDTRQPSGNTPLPSACI
jgi:hypothetical protein